MSPGLEDFVTGHRCIVVGDLISYQNDGKGWLVIPDEIEQTVSETASQRINIRADNALISADPDDEACRHGSFACVSFGWPRAIG